LIFKKEKVR